MNKRIIAGILSFALTLSTGVSLSGCGTSASAADLMAGVKARAVSTSVDLNGGAAGAVAGFAVRLLQNSAAAGKNTLISPFSVLCALAMTANGARGETLAQMEDVFGLSIPELNACLHGCLAKLSTGDNDQVSAADSIWFKDDAGLTVEADFLQTNADYYGASVYKAAFDDATLKAINAWVRDNTDGMIESILDRIPDEAVMYLINALAFDAEWEDIYREDQVRDGAFTTASGATRNAALMYHTEGRYLDDGRATGFLKYYAGQKYAFAALLPNAGVSVADYIASLTGEELVRTLDSAREAAVETAIPKFESAYSVEMRGILQSMGMTDAFDGDRADFTGLGRSEAGNIFISRVIHKTEIAVDARGTKAGAAAAVVVEASAMPPDDIKTVFLDRPFVYLLLDCETGLPLFIGTVTDTGR
ncbi:MAG: serpin family protein [Oscillospiraceae bacterium]|jgi:serpin B|nr:serpin family protein [Oscillospiraceae bacterium]